MMIKLKNKKGVAAIIAILIVMVLGVVSAILFSLQSTNFQSTANQTNFTQALYVAEGGLLYIMEHEFNNDSDFSDNTSPTAAPFGSPSLSLGNGSFWAEYLNQTASGVDIKITANVADAVRVIQQHIVVDLPVVTDYVQFASGNIHLNNADGNAMGDLYASGNIEQGSEFFVTGDVDQQGSLEIPEMDWDYYKQKAQELGTYVDNNTTFSSGTYGSEGEGNGIFYYVTGNVTINKNVTIYGTIIAEGNIKRSGNANNIAFHTQPLDIDNDTAAEDMPVLATKGNLEFNNTDGLTMNGLVYTLGNILLNNITDLTFNGAMMADGNMNINNADEINLNYDSSFFDDMEGIEQSGEGGLIISQWREVY